MSTTPSSDRYQHPIIPYHIEERYADRFDGGDVPLATAWERGIQVEAPDKHYDEARLYPPVNLLLICKNGVLKTAMFAKKTRIKALGKVRCGDCDNPHEPLQSTETCPWCGATVDAGRTTGAVTITRNGGD